MPINTWNQISLLNDCFTLIDIQNHTHVKVKTDCNNKLSCITAHHGYWLMCDISNTDTHNCCNITDKNTGEKGSSSAHQIHKEICKPFTIIQTSVHNVLFAERLTVTEYVK